MIGIYKIRNNLNGKEYVGQSNNIERRFQEHCQKGLSSRIPLDASIAKHGRENFSLSVLEECSIEKLNEREEFWIRSCDTVNKGYNCNYGGDSNQFGEFNSNAKLSEKETVFMRMAYNKRFSQREVYEKYFSDKIGFDYFQNVWQGRVWSHIMPEVFTVENKEHYKLHASRGSSSATALFSDAEVMTIRNRYVTETAKEIYEDYSERAKFNAFQQILWGRTYRDLPIYSKKHKAWINK